jgi:peroxiredoxin
MPIPEIGAVAPSFRLPVGQGGEIALEDFRGQKNVVVWFTKGMVCPFCRAQMTRVARVYPEIQSRGAEVLQVTLSSPAQARTYATKFHIPFPYLADGDCRVRREWGIESRSHGPLYYVKTLLKNSQAEMPDSDYGKFPPPMTQMTQALADDDMGFFVVDKGGIVRFSNTGSYIAGDRDRAIPSNEQILAELDRCR